MIQPKKFTSEEKKTIKKIVDELEKEKERLIKKYSLTFPGYIRFLRICLEMNIASISDTCKHAFYCEIDKKEEYNIDSSHRV